MPFRGRDAHNEHLTFDKLSFDNLMPARHSQVIDNSARNSMEMTL